MSNHLWIKLLAGVLLLGLAACDGDDGGGGGGGGGGGQPPPPQQIQERFGAVFLAAFNAAANADPIDPQPGDLPPVSFTTDPIDF